MGGTPNPAVDFALWGSVSRGWGQGRERQRGAGKRKIDLEARRHSWTLGKRDGGQSAAGRTVQVSGQSGIMSQSARFGRPFSPTHAELAGQYRPLPAASRLQLLQEALHSVQVAVHDVVA